MAIPENLREEMQDVSEEITDLMDELEELREDALDEMEESPHPGIQAAIQRIDLALRLLSEAADALDTDEE